MELCAIWILEDRFAEKSRANYRRLITLREGEYFMSFRIKKLTLEKLVFFLLCVLMVDCCIFGAGRTLSVGTIGFRMALVGVLVILTIPLLVGKFRTILSNKFLRILLVFAGWLVIQTVIGVVGGNKISFILSDLKGFAYFVLILPTLCVLTEKGRVQKLMKVMMYATAVLGIAGILLLCVYNWCPSIYLAFYRFDNHFYISAFASVSQKILRVFFKSSCYLLCGCVFPLFFILTEKRNKIVWQYPIISGVSLFVLLLSYTRSIYIAMALAAGVASVFCICFSWKKNVAKLMKNIGLSVTVFVFLIVSFNVIMGTNYLSYAFERVSVTFVDPVPDTTVPETKPPDDNINKYQNATMKSDELRKKTTGELLSLISDSPIIGHGLGKSLEVRETGYNEYFYLDLTVKTGIIGLLLFLMPFALMFFGLIKRNRIAAENWLAVGLWLAVLTGFMVFSFFNPYMNASLGISFYCCAIGVFSCMVNKPTGEAHTDSE